LVNGDTAASLTTPPTLSTTATASSHVSGNPYAITASGAVDPDYAITFAPGTLTITPVPLTITANNQTKTYDGPMPALTAVYSGFVNGDTATSLTTAPTLSTTATAASHVGAYAITLSGAVDLDYSITYIDGTLTITPRPITVTADAQTKVYGAADPAMTYQITSGNLVNGDGFSGSLTRAAGEDVGAYPIGQGSLSAGTNYTLTYVGNVLAITPATPKVTWSNPADITCGTALSSAQLDATASVPGTFTYTPVAGTILGAGGNQMLLVSFTPADSTDYTTSWATAHINVLIAQPAFSQLTPSQSITFGQTTNVSGTLAATSAIPPGEQVTISIGSASVTATISLGGSFSATINTSALGVLSTPYTITYTYAGDANFQAASDASTTLTVNRATPTLHWPNPAEIAYGTPLSSTQLDATASVPGTFTYTPALGAVLNAGAGSNRMLSVSFTPTDRTDYTTATATATISVTRATPVLTVGAPGGTYDGTPFPATVAIVSGIPGLKNTPAASLEDSTPILTYYEGGAPRAPAWAPRRPPPPGPTPSWLASPAAPTTHRRNQLRSSSRSTGASRRSPWPRQPARPCMGNPSRSSPRSPAPACRVARSPSSTAPRRWPPSPSTAPARPRSPPAAWPSAPMRSPQPTAATPTSSARSRDQPPSPSARPPLRSSSCRTRSAGKRRWCPSA
jgi:hypothetical protein